MAVPGASAAVPAASMTGARLRLGLVVIAAWLAGQIVTQGVSDSYLNGQPARAVLWRGDSADALAELALQRLVARDDAHAAGLARSALRLSPLKTAALSTFGFALDRLGESQNADRVMTLAGERGWRDALTQIWLFHRRTLDKRYAEGFDRADALLRRIDGFQPLLFGGLAAAARDPNAIGPLTDLLKRNPNWRSAFLQQLCADARPASGSLAYTLLRNLSLGPTLPTNGEVSVYLKRLVEEQKYQEAEAAWRTLSRPAPADTLIYDGAFKSGPGVTPFDWSIKDDMGWSPAIADAPEQGHGKALKVEYDGVSAPRPIRQLLALPVGDYRLAGQAFDESGVGAQSLNWRITCEGTGQLLVRVQAPAGGRGRWIAFSGNLHVPATGCPSQSLQLTAEPGDEHADILVWFDNLTIEPGTPANPRLARAGAPALGLQ